MKCLLDFHVDELPCNPTDFKQSLLTFVFSDINCVCSSYYSSALFMPHSRNIPLLYYPSNIC